MQGVFWRNATKNFVITSKIYRASFSLGRYRPDFFINSSRRLSVIGADEVLLFEKDVQSIFDGLVGLVL